MLTKLRQILLTQYIGSILIALLVWQAAVQFITIAVQSGFWLYNSRKAGSVLVPSNPEFPWYSIVVTGITIALYLLVAYVLARWLFPEVFGVKTSPAKDEPQSDESETQ